MLGKISQRPYLFEIDVMRILLIIGVIFTHTETTMANATAKNTTSRLIFNETHLMLHFTRMGFVFITGMVLMWHYYHNSPHWLDYYKRRYLRIGVPYFFWITIYLVGLILLRNQSLAEFWPRWIQTVTTGNSFYMYYLTMAVQLYLIFPVLLWLYERFERWHLQIMIGSGVLQLVMVTIIKYLQPTRGGHPWLATIFQHYGTNPLMYQLYFVMGAFVAVHYDRLGVWLDRNGKWVTIFAASLSVGTIGLYWFNLTTLGLSHHQAESIHQPFVMVMDVAVIVALLWLSRKVIQASLISPTRIHWYAQMAFGMYLTQTIFLTGLAGGLRLTHWTSWWYLIMTPVAWCLVFWLTYLLVNVMARRSPLRQLVGLQLENENKMIKSY